MTMHATPAMQASAGFQFLPASLQANVPAEQLLHSANAGFLVLRSGQLRYEFREEGLGFSSDLVEHINAAQAGYTTVFLYEELLGTHNRLHWLLHLRQPNDYHRLLEMVDHSEKWREISERERLPRKGGGGWERMFVEGSLTEAVFCPQHGLSYVGDDDHGTFQPPAMHQTTRPPDQLLNSANAPLTVHRVGQARYAVRDEARVFLYEWAGYVNVALAGEATVFLYEEMWGRQDRLHLLIHLASVDAYGRLLAMRDHDPGLRQLHAGQRVPGSEHGRGWEHLFVDGTITDTLWAPRHRLAADGGALG